VLIDKKISALENELEKLDKSKKIDAINASNIEQLLIKLSNKSDECKKLITSMKKQKNTYSFDGKNLTLSFLELIDQDQLQVISRIDIENNQNEQFYLKMNNEYFLLNVSKQNKLNRILDDSLIDELNGIN
jgi:DNA polymerase III delta prime subunit